MVRWRTHAHPDIGEDPQDVVNRQIGASVIFLGILWNRVGTPTKRAQSGTMEEFERARDLWKKSQLRHLLLYFKTAPLSCPDSGRTRSDEEGSGISDYRRQFGTGQRI